MTADGAGAGDAVDPRPRDLYVRYTRRVGLSLATAAVVNLRNVLLLPVLTRTLTPESYGAWVQLLGIVEVLTSLGMLSLTASLARYVAGEEQERVVAECVWSALAAVLVCSSVLAVVMLAVSSGITSVFLEGGISTHAVRISCLLIPVSALEKIAIAYFRARIQMGRYGAFVICEGTGCILLAVLLVKAGWGVFGIVAAFVGVRLTVLVASLAVIVRELGVARPALRSLRMYLAYCLPLMPVVVYNWALGLSDRYVISYFMGPGDAGVYSVSYSLSTLCVLVFSPIYLVINPTIAALWERGKLEELHTHQRYSLKYGLTVAIPAVTALIVLAHPIVELIAGPGYFINRLTMGLVAGGLLLMATSDMMEPYLGLKKKTGLISGIHGVCALANVGMNILLVPVLGVAGAAATTLFSYLLQLVLTCLSACRAGMPFPLEMRFLAKSALAAGGAAALMLQWPVESVLHLVGAIGTGTAGYLALLVATGAFTKREWQFWSRSLLGRAA